jgi:hypothetical protein
LVRLDEPTDTTPAADARALDMVRNDAHVHFLDTTPIQVLKVDGASSMAGDTSPVPSVLVGSPWHQIEW